MACIITKGRQLPCKSAFGGIKAAYFIDFNGTVGGVATGLGTITKTDGTVTAITGTPTVYKYDVKGASSLETAITSSRDTGTTFYTQTFTYLDVETQQEIQLIAASRPQVVVEDYYGNMFVCGIENGCEMVSGTIGTGAAAGDLSGFVITMEGIEEDAAPWITSSLITTATQGTQIDPTA
mgnify:CR=1 FL=1